MRICLGLHTEGLWSFSWHNLGRDTEGLYFEATVLMQGADEAYTTQVPNAEKELYHLVNDQVTISGLNPGRRFLIRLKPVDSVGSDYVDVTLKVNGNLSCHLIYVS